jgi:hypothetical protein
MARRMDLKKAEVYETVRFEVVMGVRDGVEKCCCRRTRMAVIYLSATYLPVLIVDDLDLLIKGSAAAAPGCRLRD